MIQVHIAYHDEKVSNIEVKEHALFAPDGQDNVCAGVSATVIGALNALQEINKFGITKEDARILVKVEEQINMHDEIVLETMIIQIKTIAQSYSKNVRVIEERREK